MAQQSQPRMFGLVAGLGIGAGIFYYRSLVNAHLARGLSPRILMVHADVRRVTGLAAARQTQELATYLTGLLRQLAGGGAQIATIPAFSPQICARELAEMTPIPLISLLDEHTALVDLPWLAVETIELLKSRGYDFIEIDYSERDTLACNVLSLGGKRLLAIEENRKTNDKLRVAGFDVRTFPGSEICINGSGGPTCLTRPLLRG